LNKKSHLLLYLQVLEHLNDDVGDNNEVQENVNNGPEVNFFNKGSVWGTFCSNKLCSCFKESDNKVNVVADQGKHIKDVIDVIDIEFKTFNSELNVFIVELKYFPSKADNAQEKSCVPRHWNNQLAQVRNYEQHNIGSELIFHKLFCLIQEHVIDYILKSLLLIDTVSILKVDVFYHLHELKFWDSYSFFQLKINSLMMVFFFTFFNHLNFALIVDSNIISEELFNELTSS